MAVKGCYQRIAKLFLGEKPDFFIGRIRSLFSLLIK
jgi:hypothetical protein